MSARIAIVLPRRERFSLSRFGAVALTVDDYVRHSAFRGETAILGLAVEDPRSTAFHAVTPKDTFWRRRTLGFAEGCAAYLAPEPPRHIDVHNRVEIFDRLARRFPKAAVSLWLHNDPQQMRGATRVRERRQILARARFVFCVSDWVRGRFLEGIAQESERVVLLPCAIDAMAEAARAAAKEPLIVFVGRVIGEKGALIFAEALAQALPALPGWQAMLIGPARADSSYARRVAAALAPLGSRVIRCDFAPHDEVMATFRRAAIAALPSTWDEPFGRTALEAMAAGAAVIASRRGGLPEIVGDAGLILDQPTPASLSSALIDLARDDDGRGRFQHRARARAAKRFDIRLWAAYLDQLRCDSDPELAGWRRHG